VAAGFQPAESDLASVLGGIKSRRHMR
jgi:hypothetical protein